MHIATHRHLLATCHHLLACNCIVARCCLLLVCCCLVIIFHDYPVIHHQIIVDVITLLPMSPCWCLSSPCYYSLSPSQCLRHFIIVFHRLICHCPIVVHHHPIVFSIRYQQYLCLSLCCYSSSPCCLYWFPLIVMMVPPSTFNMQVVDSWCIVKVAKMTTFTFLKNEFFFPFGLGLKTHKNTHPFGYSHCML